MESMTENEVHQSAKEADQQSADIEAYMMSAFIAEAVYHDELKRYNIALSLYRQGVDLMLNELFLNSTKSSNYLQEKCSLILDRIMTLKRLIQEEADAILPEVSDLVLKLVDATVIDVAAQHRIRQ
ncbi:hypothetical protein ACOME3_005702 [Neoechinorhynchus agilis]